MSRIEKKKKNKQKNKRKQTNKIPLIGFAFVFVLDRFAFVVIFMNEPFLNEQLKRSYYFSVLEMNIMLNRIG